MTLRIIYDAHPVVVIADVNEELKSKGLVFVGCGNPTRRTLTWELEKLPEKIRSEAMSQRIKVGDEVWLDHSRWRQTKEERACEVWPPNGSMGTMLKYPGNEGLQLFNPKRDVGFRWKVLFVDGVFPSYFDCIPNNTLLACGDLIAFTRDEHCNPVTDVGVTPDTDDDRVSISGSPDRERKVVQEELSNFADGRFVNPPIARTPPRLVLDVVYLPPRARAVFVSAPPGEGQTPGIVVTEQMILERLKAQGVEDVAVIVLDGVYVDVVE